MSELSKKNLFATDSSNQSQDKYTKYKSPYYHALIKYYNQKINSEQRG